MITYLKDQAHYEDLYDSFTVDSCRVMNSHKFDITDKDVEGQDLSPEQVEAMKAIKADWSEVAREIAVFTYAAERYKNKSQTVDKWMRDDRDKEERLAKIEPPHHVRCRECLSTNLRLISKDEYWGEKQSKRERLLFMYSCNDCETKSAFFDDGEEYRVSPTRCPECKEANPDHKTTTRKHGYTIEYACRSCKHLWKEVEDFTPTEKPTDPNYISDRKLYCYSDKVKGYVDSISRIVPLRKELGIHIEKQNEIKSHKEDLGQIQRLTIAEVIDKLKPVIKQHGYKELQLGQPDMGKQVVVPFNMIDGKSRSEDESRKNLNKLFSEQLAGTNWRLVRSSLSYRMGYLSGKLKGYESDEDLLKLIS